MLGMVAILGAATLALGPLAMLNLYVVPYWVNVIWLDIVTYLHHHGPHDAQEKVPWYRGKVTPAPYALCASCFCALRGHSKLCRRQLCPQAEMPASCAAQQGLGAACVQITWAHLGCSA